MNYTERQTKGSTRPEWVQGRPPQPCRGQRPGFPLSLPGACAARLAPLSTPDLKDTHTFHQFHPLPKPTRIHVCGGAAPPNYMGTITFDEAGNKNATTAEGKTKENNSPCTLATGFRSRDLQGEFIFPTEPGRARATPPGESPHRETPARQVSEPGQPDSLPKGRCFHLSATPQTGPIFPEKSNF